MTEIFVSYAGAHRSKRCGIARLRRNPGCDHRKMAVAEFDTTKLLAHASQRPANEAATVSRILSEAIEDSALTDQ